MKSTIAYTLLACLTAFCVNAREEVNFDKDWKFDRFGPMPEGGVRVEPGSTGKLYTVAVSSEDWGNFRHRAIDGNETTRWYAANDSPGQWLALHLSSPHKISELEILWEKEAYYQFRVEGASNGLNWKTIAELSNNQKNLIRQKVRLNTTLSSLRIFFTGLEKDVRAGIREVKLYGHDKKVISNHFVSIAPHPSLPDYDDAQWRQLTVPHDWGIEGPFRADLPGGTGKLPWKGIGWYRKNFTLPSADTGKRIFIDFDGVMSHARVWINGVYVGGWPYGYNSFRLELTDHLFFGTGATNVLAVRCDTTAWDSRWYPGAGIYRHVRLVKTAPVHIAHWGVWVRPATVTVRRVTAGIEVNVRNQSCKKRDVTVQSTLHENTGDGSPGKKVATSTRQILSLAALSNGVAKLHVRIDNPKLWDIEAPHLYTVRTELAVDGVVVDRIETITGFRTIEFTPRNGFLLNGRRVDINGVCNHHDLGPLGAAVNTRAIERQLELLQEMGCNAVRTSHNVATPELIELCNRMGILVQEESFDCWKNGKLPNDYNKLFDEWHEKDLQALVRRDRNNPSIIMWSIGNEVPDQDKPWMAKKLTGIIHREDPTRSVTEGVNWGGAGWSGFQHSIDVMGYNYTLWAYNTFLTNTENKTIPLHGSETASTVSSRGEYFFPVQREDVLKSEVNRDFQVSSYDLHAPHWGTTPDEQFEKLDRFPMVLGEFVWTGFDYLGEPTPYDRSTANLLNFSDPAKRDEMKKLFAEMGLTTIPSRSSYFGIFDLAGFRKDRFYLYQSRWRPDHPMVHILPHWNWPERISMVTPVHVYTSGDEVELFLNGRLLGRKKKDTYAYRLCWDDVRYTPGELKAVAYKKGKEWATAIVRTTGNPVALTLETDRDTIRADGQDLAFVTVKVVDKNGDVVPRSRNMVHFEIDGPGEIIAVGNGDATSFEPFQATRRSAFNGLCLAIIRSVEGRAGTIKLNASSKGLGIQHLTIYSKPARK
jgi:beta-galactosidase